MRDSEDSGLWDLIAPSMIEASNQLEDFRQPGRANSRLEPAARMRMDAPDASRDVTSVAGDGARYSS